ncbi:zinc finger domain-containing protein [Nocardia salmonicida]|uniref:zinc finger domain-containing protein n=1 Tax=Nocardia salmonicida TaxID=53431 RepID=UPI003F5414CF
MMLEGDERAVSGQPPSPLLPVSFACFGQPQLPTPWSPLPAHWRAKAAWRHWHVDGFATPKQVEFLQALVEKLVPLGGAPSWFARDWLNRLRHPSDFTKEIVSDAISELKPIATQTATDIRDISKFPTWFQQPCPERNCRAVPGVACIGAKGRNLPEYVHAARKRRVSASPQVADSRQL